MKINFRKITEQNWLECIFLTTNQEGKHNVCEEFVASNALSIAQSKIQKGWITKAIYNEDNMVGFTMYGYSYEHDFYEICRIMIDHKHQGKGYGREALIKVIDEMKKVEDCNEIYLSFDPDNKRGQKLYESLGFEGTGRLLGDELLYCLEIKNHN